MSYVKVYKYKKQISLDNGVTWQDVTPEEYVPSGDPIGYYDTYEECIAVYRTIQSGTTCVGYDKHNQDVYEVSYDNGVTWSVVSTSAGTLIEADSPDCGYVPPTPTSRKYILTLQDSSTASAECDSTSAITQDEISAYTSTTVYVEIGECVTSIDIYAFFDCRSLTSVTIPNSVTSIDTFAFGNCTSLTSIDIPDSVTNIGVAAFLYCTSLTSVTIGSGVTSIGINAFQDCSSLTSVTVNAATPPILGEGAFDDTNNCPIYVPCESVNAYKLASGWSDYASRIQCNEPVFSGKYKLTLSDSSTVSAECDATSAITQAEISAYTGSVISAKIGNCVNTINASAFYGCSGLTSVTIPDSVTTIGQAAFNKCSGLTSIYIPNSVNTISGAVFGDCSSLTSVNIPSGITMIGNSTFYGCSSLTDITIPDNVQLIDTAAFENCTSLSSVTIGSGVTTIGSGAFEYCSRLTNIVIPNSVNTIDTSAFYGCSGLTSVTIGNNVVSIGDISFNYCVSLTGITIPDSVTSIGNSAFIRCSGLTSVIIGSGVTSIGNSVFRYCSGLTSITVKATTPPTLGSNVFYNNNAPIYVPCDSLSAYQSAWSAYASRLQCITKQKKYLFEGSESFAQWYVARFSKSEGFLQVYFEHDINGIMDYLYGNNEPLYVEFSSVPESGTLCLQDGSWSTIFDAALPVSTSEPLQIYITDSTMYNVIYTHDLALIDKASNGFTITKVYYYE